MLKKGHKIYSKIVANHSLVLYFKVPSDLAQHHSQLDLSTKIEHHQQLDIVFLHKEKLLTHILSNVILKVYYQDAYIFVFQI